MKRSLLALSLLIASAAPSQYGIRGVPASRPEALQPDIPLTEHDPAFPLRVHLFNVRWGGLGTRNHGYGTGNLLDAVNPQGFDFAFECDVPFTPNADPAGTYQARWKKSPYQLEILTVGVDGKAAHTCNLHLALEARPFSEANRAHFDHGVSSSLRTPWTDPGFAYEGPAPDYPIQFHVLDGQRKEDVYGNHGWGTANLVDPQASSLQGADYNYDCGRGFITSSQLDNFYQGRWTKPGHELELLLQRPGSDKVDRCTVTVSLKPDPYPERRSRAQTPAQTPAPAPSMSFLRCQAQEHMHCVFALFRQQLFLDLRVPMGSGTGRRLATVAQTSIRGLATARTCVVAGLPRT